MKQRGRWQGFLWSCDGLGLWNLAWVSTHTVNPWHQLIISKNFVLTHISANISNTPQAHAHPHSTIANGRMKWVRACIILARSVRFTVSNHTIIRCKNTTQFQAWRYFNRTRDNPALPHCLRVNMDRSGWCLQGTTQTSKKDTQRKRQIDVLLLTRVQTHKATQYDGWLCHRRKPSREAYSPYSFRQ